MFIKFAKTKIVDVRNISDIDTTSKLYTTFEKLSSITLNPKRYLYLRNRAISAGEYYGPNENADYFPIKELENRYRTFVGSRVSIDHRDELIIGVIADSEFFQPEYINNKFVKGGIVENILSVDKEIAEKFRPGIINDILEKKITDTSMGAIVESTKCSICNNVARTQDEFCEHIKYAKGSKIKIASGEEQDVYEICQGVTFFEDSIIVPLEFGGLAGGAGADLNAKILERVATQTDKMEKDIGLLIDEIYKKLAGKDKRNFEDFIDILLRKLSN